MVYCSLNSDKRLNQLQSRSLHIDCLKQWHRLEWILFEWSNTCSSEKLSDRNNNAANCRWLAYKLAANNLSSAVWIFMRHSANRPVKTSTAVKVQPFVRKATKICFSGNPLGTLACLKFYPLFSTELQLLLFYLSLRLRSLRSFSVEKVPIKFFETNWQTEKSGFSWTWGFLKGLTLLGSTDNKMIRLQFPQFSVRVLCCHLLACACVMCGKFTEWTSSYTLFLFIMKTLRVAWPKKYYCATFVTSLILAWELNKTLVHFDFHQFSSLFDPGFRTKLTWEHRSWSLRLCQECRAAVNEICWFS